MDLTTVEHRILGLNFIGHPDNWKMLRVKPISLPLIVSKNLDSNLFHLCLRRTEKHNRITSIIF